MLTSLQTIAAFVFVLGVLVFIHELGRPDKDYAAATFGDGTHTFTAEPVWDGDRVYLTAFSDIAAEYVPPLALPPLSKEAKAAAEVEKKKEKAP